jgi:hypothetical protein
MLGRGGIVHNRGRHRAGSVGFGPKNLNLPKTEMHKSSPTSAHFFRRLSRLTVESGSGCVGRIYTGKRQKIAGKLCK